MIMSYLLRKLLPWIIEIGLWLSFIAGAILGYGESDLDLQCCQLRWGAYGRVPRRRYPSGHVADDRSQQSACWSAW